MYIVKYYYTKSYAAESFGSLLVVRLFLLCIYIHVSITCLPSIRSCISFIYHLYTVKNSYIPLRIIYIPFIYHSYNIVYRMYHHIPNIMSQTCKVLKVKSYLCSEPALWSPIEILRIPCNVPNVLGSVLKLPDRSKRRNARPTVYFISSFCYLF